MTDTAIPIHSARVRGMVPGYGHPCVELQLSPTRSFQEITVSIPVELARSLALDLLQTAITTQVVQSVQHGGIQQIANHRQQSEVSALSQSPIPPFNEDTADPADNDPRILPLPMLPDHLRTDRSPL